MKLGTCIALMGIWLAGLGGPAHSDVITDWNDAAVAAGYAARQGPPAHTRVVAMVHLAMFEAVNSIAPRYVPYRRQLPAEPGTSPEAAAAAAAHYLLSRIYPQQVKEFDKVLAASLGAVADGTARSEGLRLGEAAAAAMLAERSSDGADAPNTYRPFTEAGKYVPTVFPVFSGWGTVRPFALKRGDQFRPPAPYALTSAEWVKDYDEVKRLGVKSGAGRSPEQTDIGRFWQLTGAATYNPLVRQLSEAKRLDVMQNARLFALVAMAAADAYIAVFDAKYAYNFWRPVTAIRNADLHRNSAIVADPAWEPLVSTPLHPEYPCAHCIVQSSAATVLEHFFGDSIPPAKMTSATAPGVNRSYSRLSDYVAEVIDARIYGGMHYRTSGEVGAAMGRRIGEFVVQNYLKPAD